MKAWDFNAVVYEGMVFCVECLPKGISTDNDAVMPIFESEEADHYPVCDACHKEHEYIGLTTEGLA